MEEKNPSGMYAVRAPDGGQLDRFVSEEDMDSGAITHVPTISAKVVNLKINLKPEDELFSAFSDHAGFNSGDQRWRNCTGPF